MHVLHICPDFPHTELYYSLFKELQQLGIKQTVYIPTYNITKNEKSINYDIENLVYIYSPIIKRWMTYLYGKKISTVVTDIEKKIDFKDIDIIHSHYFFSAGCMGHKLSIKYNIPHVVVARSTDVALHFPYRLNYRAYAHRMMLAASKIIFISKAHQSYVEKQFLPKKEDQKEKVIKKMLVLPNGVDKFWFSNKGKEKTINSDTINFLFVGELSKNKNIHGSIKLLQQLRKHISVQFTVIGRHSDYQATLEKEFDRNKEWVNYLGEIKDKSLLRAQYAKADIFIMLSFSETFGLSYVESISQGTPVLYSKGEGIDQYFEDGQIGYPLSYKNIDESIEKIKKLIKNYKQTSKECTEKLSYFHWKHIAFEYNEIYTSSIKNHNPQ